MRTVSARAYGIIFSLLISFVMSVFMSFIMVAVNVGFGTHFLQAWLGSIAIGFVAAFPIATIAVPLIQKLLRRYLSIKAAEAKKPS